MDNINEIIGQNLLTLRKNKKLTQLELAEKFKSRESFYANNDFAFDVGDLSPMNIADKIIDLYKKL